MERYMEKPNQEVEEELKLYVSGDSKGGAGSGVVRATPPAALTGPASLICGIALASRSSI